MILKLLVLPILMLSKEAVYITSNFGTPPRGTDPQ
jgi:hypothetical protein